MRWLDLGDAHLDAETRTAVSNAAIGSGLAQWDG
jgi:hypothetical protein